MKPSLPHRKKDTLHSGSDSYQDFIVFLSYHYRVTVVSLNDQKQTVYRETSGIKQASLGRNGQVLMLELDPTMTVFPLLLSFNFCLSTPLISPQVAKHFLSKILINIDFQMGNGAEIENYNSND